MAVNCGCCSCSLTLGHMVAVQPFSAVTLAPAAFGIFIHTNEQIRTLKFTPCQQTCHFDSNAPVSFKPIQIQNHDIFPFLPPW